jgi:hypothetical protein
MNLPKSRYLVNGRVGCEPRFISPKLKAGRKGKALGGCCSISESREGTRVANSVSGQRGRTEGCPRPVN